MHVNLLPADQVSADKAEAFPPGSLVFAPYAEHRAERFQLGVRIGQDRQVLALTPWFGGHRQSGCVIEPRTDRPLFGIKAVKNCRPILDFDPSALTQEAPDAWRGALGLLGFSETGLTLYAKADDPNGLPSSRGVLIDPVTWDIVETEPRHFPTTWTSAWSLRFPLTDRDWFVIAPDRLATGA